ncbi:MAG: FKBP-type peptidyl-prolyl cis-trans isomerase [Candidatus Methanoperedens sp.]|nr:FKBP-type peptidyl-prolyl cis-trans isomerase [Candidatus Methanoperedens sp.]
MKKFVILLLAALILLSGCVGQKAVKTGDNISVDYTGSLENGKVFDTSIEKVAIVNNLSAHGREYKPLKFTVGKGEIIKGFDAGVIGMKVGETKTITVSPEEGYGPSNPQMIQVIPTIEEIPVTRAIQRDFEVPIIQFETLLGPGHKSGEIVRIPDTNINLTIRNITSNVSLSYNLKIGDDIWSSRAPWNETVVKIDNKNITLRANVSVNNIVQFEGAPWNSTVVGLDNVNITLRHNPIPETTINVPGIFGQLVPMKISFNETSIILDQNHKLAGKTLVFNATLLSIDK